MIVEKKVKKNLDKIYNAALSAANPINCVGKFLEEKDDILKIGNKKYDLNYYKKIYIISFGKAAYLNTSLSKVNTKTISIPTIMVHQFLKGPECGSPSNEKSTFVKLPDSIMFHCISISN